MSEKKKNLTLSGPLTQTAIAETLGLSYVTVNRVLNGSSCCSEDTRRRVMELCDKLGYRKNRMASSLVKKRTNLLGLILCGTQEGFFSQIAYGVQAKARELGYDVLLSDSESVASNELRAMQSFLELQVSGVIVQPIAGADDLGIYDKLRERGTAILTIDNYVPEVCSSFLGTNSKEGMAKAVKYLAEIGHTQIACIAGNQKFSTFRDRVAGYRIGMEREGLSVRNDWIIELRGKYTTETAVAVDALMKLSPRPTAVVTSSDGVAIMAILHLFRCGYSVPDDISVVGYSNQPECVFSPVPLTTIDQRPQELGQRAVELVVNMAEKPGSKPIREIWDDCLIVRESCKAVYKDDIALESFTRNESMKKVGQKSDRMPCQ